VIDQRSLEALAAIARDAQMPGLGDEAAALADRLTGGRFYVAAVGQFKRGKSTVLNALVGEPVLPTGVTPVTSTVTILRYGATRRAVVTYATGRSEEIPITDIHRYVTGEHNPENARGVAVVEIPLPAPILARGLCLVDTPGVGSVLFGNTAVTRAFVPQVDVALVILGADPPISGDELSLVQDVLAGTPNVIVAINKADRQPLADVLEARQFTERLLEERLGRPIGPVLQISAAERLGRPGPTRDWPRLEAALCGLAAANREIVLRAGQRGATRLAALVGHELDERRGALTRPIAESERRLSRLARSIADAETAIGDVGVLLAAEQRRFLDELERRRQAFVDRELAPACRELEAWVGGEASRATRAAVFEKAAGIAATRVEAWLCETEPLAAALYMRATDRWTKLANELVTRLEDAADSGFSSLSRRFDPEEGFREPRRFYPTHLMHLTARGPGQGLADLARSRRSREARDRREAEQYLGRLIRTNTTRVMFDLERRFDGSRTRFEAALKLLLRDVSGSVERALAGARAQQRCGADTLARNLIELDALRRRLQELEMTSASPDAAADPAPVLPEP
jgi:hypothetical protein